LCGCWVVRVKERAMGFSALRYVLAFGGADFFGVDCSGLCLRSRVALSRPSFEIFEESGGPGFLPGELWGPTTVSLATGLERRRARGGGIDNLTLLSGGIAGCSLRPGTMYGSVDGITKG